MTKQELKAPDRIWLASKSAFDWAAERWMGVAIILVVTFVGTLGYSIYWGIKTQTESKAQYHYAKAKALYEQLALGGAEVSASTLEEIQKELAKLDQVYGNTTTNRLADLIRAHLSLNAGKTDEALRQLSNYSSALPSSSKDLGLYPSAVTKEQSGKLDEALKDYTAVAQMEASAFRELAYLGKARVLRSLKKTDEAVKTYSEFLEKFPSSMEVGRVRGTIALLQATKTAP